jgi:hypothetical protein
MICIRKPIHSWQEFQLVALDFFETGEDYLLLLRNLEHQAKIMSCKNGLFPELDLIQFCDLGLFERGELGIRELHWKISDFITSSRAIELLVRGLAKIPVQAVKKLNTRHKSMQDRRRAVISLMRGFVTLGLIIPHYVEPRNTTVIISRSFTKALLEFNPNGVLSFERTFFALARTANFKCVRISRISR